MFDTIYSLASGALPSAIAIIRISGPQTLSIIASMTGLDPRPNHMYYTNLNTQNGELIDTVMMVFFKKPHSFTGEDSAEFFLHGSKPIINLFMEELAKFPGVRPSELGEYSRRSFYNGKMDLIEAESLADLYEAETEAQRKLSIKGTSKELSKLYNSWRNEILEAMAYITAELDFSQEEDIASLDNTAIWKKLENLANSITTHLSFAKTSDIIKNGYKVALIGKPNAGKSSLFNKICGKNTAIVTEIPGTTRDVIEGKLNLAGLDVFFFDTAGIRETEDKVEKIGVERSKEKIEEADLIFYLKDINDTENLELPNNKEIWQIYTKQDVSRETSAIESNIFYTSIYNNESIENLKIALQNHIKHLLPEYGAMLPVKQRHIYLLQETINNLKEAIEKNYLPIEIRVEFIRNAANNIGQIIGKIDVENILDIIFSKFCVGK